jgi:hypothetical protein
VALSGSQHAITPARSGVLRSGAGRSGWPLSVGWKVPLYALSNIARSAATRSNYVSPKGFVTIGGGQVGTGATGGKVVGDLQITDALNELPNRCTFRVRGMVPKVGQDVVVTLGSQNTLERLFAGQVLNYTHRYLGSPLLPVFDVNAIDWTWGLHQRLFSHRWTNASATTIAKEIVALGAPGYTTDGIATTLPTLTEFTVTDLDAPQALTALAKRIGGYWYVDYLKDVHLWTDTDPRAGTDPAVLNPVHPTLTDLTVATDGSQLVTRVYVEGGGSTALTEVVPGETLLPVGTASWYEAAGGMVKAGPQRIRYTGRSLGGGGSLVGPGASPSAALTATVIGGAGVTAGAHDYAVSFVTATGESLTGPRAAVVVGAIASPLTAPTAGALQAGTGPDPGDHWWAVSFVTATGETTIGPPLILVVPAGVDVLAAPTAGAPTTGGSLEAGSFTYAITFGTPSGQSVLGPGSNTVTCGTVTTSLPNAPAPTIGGTGPNNTEGDLTPGHFYSYAVAWSLSSSSSVHTAQTGLSANMVQAKAEVSLNNLAKSSHILIDVPYGPAGTQWIHLYRVDGTVTPGNNATDYRLLASLPNSQTTGTARFTDTIAQSAIASAPAGSATNTATASTTTNKVPLTNVPIGPAGVTRRYLYRSNGAGYRLVTTITNNTATTYTDTTATASLGAAPPTVNTTAASQVPLQSVPIGGPDITARRIYRTRAHTSDPWGLVGTLADNTSTTFLDTVADAALGAAPPLTTTALANRVQLSTIPLGAGSVTARKVYRTAAGGGALKLLTTLADNATTTYLDALADAALGAAPPGSDTSGLTQPAGQVTAGSTAVIVASAAAFLPAGGWAVIGNGQQVIRYTGQTANALTGVPPSGPGAIVASISYNSTITAAPMLLGVPASGDGAIVYVIPKGDDVNLWIQVDDAVAQAAAALLFTSAAGGTHSGIIEDVIQDRRLSAVEARARGTAHLAQRRDVQLRIAYRSRDVNSRSGRTVTVNLLAPPYSLSAQFIIQSVRIHDFTPALLPLFDVEASSARFSFEDLLRRIGTRTDPTG